MSEPSPPVRSISDTARWVACFRALETKRPDALFRDPYAERLAGERGFEIAKTLPEGTKHEWAWVARTYLFDQFLLREVRAGAELVINLAAGLDARPYRMPLPATLQWIEVDLPEIISYKEGILREDRPNCRLERIPMDLSDVPTRRSYFAELNRLARKIVVLSEGLLIYFAPEEVGALARDLSTGWHFSSWIIDLASPGQLKLMQRTTGKRLSEAGAAFKFAPSEGADFFVPHGWQPKDVKGLLETAVHFKRTPSEMLAWLPGPTRTSGDHPWTGVCLLKKR
jgi:methyltransferase (TIGR00027 family)